MKKEGNKMPNIQKKQNMDLYQQEDQELQQMQQQLIRVKNLIRLIIAFTDWSDWVSYDQGKTVFLMGSGAEKIARQLGIKFKNFQTWMEEHRDEQGRLVERICYAEADFYISFTGYERELEKVRVGVSTNDGILAYNRKGDKLPADLVSPRDLQKVAYTKLIQEGVRRL